MHIACICIKSSSLISNCWKFKDLTVKETHTNGCSAKPRLINCSQGCDAVLQICGSRVTGRCSPGGYTKGPFRPVGKLFPPVGKFLGQTGLQNLTASVAASYSRFTPLFYLQ